MRTHHVLAVALMLPCAAAAQDHLVRREFRELHMGLEVRMIIWTAGDEEARAGARAAFDRVASLEEMMSDYRASSEVRRLAQRAPQAMTVSPELLHVLRVAREVARQSSGAFDPTAGSLVGLWRAARRTGRLPGPAAIADARATVGWDRVDIDTLSRRVALPALMTLDLGGVAKGYIIGDALRVLRERGISRALIEAGGDIVVGDAPPGTDGWQVATPHGDTAVAVRARRLVNAALSTSGPGGQYLEVQGIRHSHVIDPRTGWAVTTPSHATVIATDPALADALATALTVVAPGERATLMRAFRSSVIAWSVSGG